MNLLLINSSDKEPFVALYKNGELITYHASQYLQSANPHNKKPDKLVNCLDALRKEHIIKDVDAIAVTIGPGSFTGIRVGLSLAKGLAFGLKTKLIPITNFDLTLNRLENISPEKRYCTVIPSKLPEYYYSVKNMGNDYEKGCTEFEDLTKTLQKDTIFVGDFDDETQIKHSYFEFINVKKLKKEAVSLAELAVSGFTNGKILDAENTEPLYLKDFNL
ncbi:MAG: tRNA (adenosine(37)-N6)-threonylcarbamoyltransferase complex dimerization subunit type 1 TsaB, partial [Ignavibacteria bacterium]|nr:tRNA (adenosine(37)-N6)-threonylcarbamoyltransferase complex dimerization subunit type 1 TsaB [Ignavibacteria bacterium]